MSQRERWEKEAIERLNKHSHTIGAVFELVEIQDLRVSIALQTQMSQTALAKQQSLAKVIIAEGELGSATMFKQAADALSSNNMSMQLQYIELIKELAKINPSKIVLPDSIIGGWNNDARYQ